jgi:hypothetical protein
VCLGIRDLVAVQLRIFGWFGLELGLGSGQVSWGIPGSWIGQAGSVVSAPCAAGDSNRLYQWTEPPMAESTEKNGEGGGAGGHVPT